MRSAFPAPLRVGVLAVFHGSPTHGVPWEGSLASARLNTAAHELTADHGLLRHGALVRRPRGPTFGGVSQAGHKGGHAAPASPNFAILLGAFSRVMDVWSIREA